MTTPSSTNGSATTLKLFASASSGITTGMIGRPYLERALQGSRKHAARRVDEMEAARDLLVELGVEPRIASASAAQLAELASDGREVRS